MVELIKHNIEKIEVKDIKKGDVVGRNYYLRTIIISAKDKDEIELSLFSNKEENLKIKI